MEHCRTCNHPQSSHAPLHHGVNSCQDCPAGSADHVYQDGGDPVALSFHSEAGDGFIVTLNCKCGWEAMFILPEECFTYLIAVLTHAKEAHGTVMPEMEHRTL